LSGTNITKKALADSMKQLMLEYPFSKITVGDICQNCSLSRKSFYYHFIDKYDLMNWIFDQEFLLLQPSADFEDSLLRLCTYLHANRLFYQQALSTQGPNSFCEHFRALCLSYMHERLNSIKDVTGDDSFIINFFADALICALERWILQDNPCTPQQFVEQLKVCIQLLASAAL